MNEPRKLKTIPSTWAAHFFCPECGSRPCIGPPICDGAIPSKVVEPPDVLSITRPKGGRSIPFFLFDGGFARKHNLSAHEQLALKHVCRHTFGKGHFHGNKIPLWQLAEDMNCHKATVCRALNGLQKKGLIRRERQFKDSKRPCETTYIGVIIPGYWEPPEVNNEHDSGG